MRWALAVLFVAGCDHLLQLEDIRPPRDAMGDAMPDTVDTPDAATMGPCFSETFSGSALDVAMWKVYSTAAPPTPQLFLRNGVLEIDLSQGTPSTTMAYNGLDSVVTYPMAGGWVEVQLVAVPTDSSAEVQLYAARSLGPGSLDTSNEYVVAIKNGQLLLVVHSSGTVTSSNVAFQPATDLYLRIRDGGDGSVYVDTAPAPGQWATRIQAPATVSFDMLYVGAAAGTDPPGASSPQVAKLDNLDVISPACKP